jgi:hypothetical protein
MEVPPINPTPYANANVHDSVPHVTDNYSRINGNQHHMQMPVLMIRSHMLLLFIAESMQNQQGMQMLTLMIWLHMLLITQSKSMIS